MRWAVIILIGAFLASCVNRGSDSFVTAGGLQDIRSRQDLFIRDIQLAAALTGAPYDGLPVTVRDCLVAYAIDHASPELLASADGFVLYKTEASWQQYRRESGDGFDVREIGAMTRACETAATLLASR